MKKIIGGKMYDTEKARMVGDPWSPAGFMSSDFDWYEETLYRKRTGEYFLHGAGGPKTRYAEPYGQSGWTGGERIMPLSYNEAREWAEEHLDTDAYIGAFGNPDEGKEGVSQLSVRNVPNDVIAALDRMTSETGRTKADLIVEALEHYVKESI